MNSNQPAPIAMGGHTEPEALPRFMNIRQVADYLQLNEKKIYSLASEGQIPATKITGKWLFPRNLVDQWLLESSHGGVLHDRLVVVGSDDPLLHRLVGRTAHNVGGMALLSYSPTGTRQGLDLLAKGRAEVAAIHWGPAEESHFRHPALLNRYPQHKNWLLIHAFRREIGAIVAPGQRLRFESLTHLFSANLRWALRQQGSGAQRFLEEALQGSRRRLDQLNHSIEALSEREIGARILAGEADAGPGCRATATEFGLDFVSAGWESFDLVLPRGVFFRNLFKEFMQQLETADTRQSAERLGGYDLSRCGKLLWSS